MLGYSPKATHMFPVIETTGFKKVLRGFVFSVRHGNVIILFVFGTLWAKVNFLPMFQGLPFVVGTPSTFLGSHPISPPGDRRV